ncbi:hypothetical protein SLS62_001357 [Diatrype stigma]|uniref:Uncharacterized protein n=1 Tax=Diatrype stigma TaxID=117547 RepID=A0AAN9V020_9PEZI
MASTVPMDITSSSNASGEPTTAPAPASVRGSEYAAVLGGIYPSNHVVGTLPPLIPVPDPDGLQWDTGVDHSFGMGVMGIKGGLERRHSGWEAVEKQWIQGELAREQEASTQKKQQQQTIKTHGERSENAREAMRMFPYPYISIPAPRLESDFRIKVALSAQTAAVAAGGSDRDRNRFKRYTTYTGGTWSGHFGYGTVVSGGQETQDLVHGKTSGMLIEATQRLKTEDNPPA